MARSFAEDIVETSTTTGTGAYTLAGPKGDYFPFEESFVTGDQPVYVVRNYSNTKIEFNRGGAFTEGDPATLARSVWKSTNGDAAVSWTVDDHPLTIYIPGSAELHEGVVTGWLATGRHALLRAGASWFDSVAGVGVSWTHYLYNGTANVWRGRYDAAKSIYIGSNNAPIRDTGTSGATIGVNDRGYIISLDTSSAVRVAALLAVATAAEGFYFGLYADGIFPAVIDSNGSEAVDRAVVPPKTVVWVRSTGTKWLTQGNSNHPLVGRRQTVTRGPLSSGAPNLLATVSGLALSTSNVAAATPLVVRASNGDAERWGWATGNVSFGTLADATTSYLYVTVGTDGLLTGGKTTVVPVEQKSGTPGITSGQITFNYGEMKCYLGNGSTADEVFLVLIGQAVTSGGNVTAVTAYAYNGEYDSGWTQNLPASGASVSKNANLGVSADCYKAEFIIQCTTTDGGYAVGDTVDELGYATSGSQFGKLAVRKTRNTVATTYGNNGGLVQNASSGALLQPTQNSWKYKFTARRNY